MVASGKWRKLAERQLWLCYYCGEEYGIMTVDHRQPRCRGGRGGRNLVAACYGCNKLKSNLTEEEFWQCYRRADELARDGAKSPGHYRNLRLRYMKSLTARKLHEIRVGPEAAQIIPHIRRRTVGIVWPPQVVELEPQWPPKMAEALA